MKKIGMLRHNYLPMTEGFIYAGVRAIEATAGYTVQPIALRQMNPTRFPEPTLAVLEAERWGRLQAFSYRTFARAPQLRRWLASVDLVHAHMGWTGCYAYRYTRAASVPLVTSYYGQDATVLASRARFHPSHWMQWARAAGHFATAARIIVLSEDMKRGLVAQGCPAEKIRIVHLGINLEKFSLATRHREARLRVLMVGREVEKKGFDDGLRACALAREGGTELEVVHIGTNGPLQAELHALAQRLGVPVQWLPASTSVAQEMAASDVLLVPSKVARDGDKEGTPTVICEGSASGLAVVATRHAGIPEQVEDGVTGLLADESDCQGLAAHLQRLAREPDTREAMGRKGRQKMELEYNLASLGGAIEAVYREIL